VRGSDRAILLVLPLIAAVIAVWILVISPKRSEESDLQDQVAALQTQADQIQGQADQAELARKQFNRNYAALVDLGAAAPADDDQSTLLFTLADIANSNDLRFSDFTLSDTPTGVDTSVTATTTAPPASTSTSGTSTESGATTSTTESTDTSSTATGESATSTSTTTTSTAAPVVPTESAAATLPLGAAIGPAGLPVSSYSFTLDGQFFNAADFLRDIDKLVESSANKGPQVHGRLLTIDGFSFSLPDLTDYPTITASLAVTAYEVPPEQGLQAGATPAGPAPAGTTTTSTSTTTAAPTASVSP
jgi:hypothetical protein